MTNHPGRQEMDQDIQQAVSEVQASSGVPWYASVMKEVPYRPPVSTNRLIWIFWFSRCLSWGLTSALWKLGAAIKRHPWISILGVGGAVAMCPLCVYSTGCIIGGLAIWGLKTESALEEKSMNSVTGEFMQ